MIELDPSQFAPEIATLLMTRGAGVPPLHWPSAANRIGKTTLDGIPDEKLFGRPNLVNAALGKGVRALLYLWTGWPAECIAQSERLPLKESLYLKALSERQNEQYENSKSIFRDLDMYATYQYLSQYTVQLLASSVDPSLTRFRKMIELDNRWEPFLFTDLFQQARANKLQKNAVDMVRQLQCYEFEILMRFWYEQATGEKLPQRSLERSTAEQEANIQRTRKLAEKHQARLKKPAKKPADEKQKQEEAAVPGGPQQSQEGDAPVPMEFKVVCPKCKMPMLVPESARGTKQSCKNCHAVFMLPPPRRQDPAMPSMPAAPASNAIGIRCPRCKFTLRVPETSRGQKERCSKCGAIFLVPAAKPPVPQAPGS